MNVERIIFSVIMEELGERGPTANYLPLSATGSHSHQHSLHGQIITKHYQNINAFCAIQVCMTVNQGVQIYMRYMFVLNINVVLEGKMYLWYRYDW